MRALIPLFLLFGTADQYDREDRTRIEPIHASVWFDAYSGRASFDVSRRAHVALFAMRPFGAVEMIYPSWGDGRGARSFRAGRHRVRADSRLYHLTGSRGYGSYHAREPLYIILIASDRPLHLDSFHGTRTAHWLSHPSITWSPFLTADRLAAEIVAGYGRADWTVAYDVIWPQGDFHYRDGRVPRTRVLCPGGRVIWVATQAVHAGWFRCPDRRDRPHYGRPVDGRRGEDARPATRWTPPIRGTVPTRARPRRWEGATPTTRPSATQRTRPLRGVVTRPVTRPKPASRPAAGSSRRPAAAPKARPAPRARPRPRPKPRPGGGGASGGG